MEATDYVSGKSVVALQIHRIAPSEHVRLAVRTRRHGRPAEEVYLRPIRSFTVSYDKLHLVHMGKDQIAAFLNQLAAKRNVRASTQNRGLCPIVFFCREILDKEVDEIQELLWAKKPKGTPKLFSRSEVRGTFSNLQVADGQLGLWFGFARPGRPDTAEK